MESQYHGWQTGPKTALERCELDADFLTRRIVARAG